MELLHTIQEVRDLTKSWRSQGESIGFVPTMGFLHEGHGSLIEKARAENQKVVVSIFVNPTQFAPGEDLESYPRDEAADQALCQSLGVDAIFFPTPDEMYPTPSATTLAVPSLSTGLCGGTRPTHFAGVCLVVCKLFHIVAPHRSYFGQKDAQQLAVIRQMTADLNIDVEIIGCPIVREADGLAKSSRNSYLSPEERKAALILSQALELARTMLDQGVTSPQAILPAITGHIASEPLAKLDYVQLVDSRTLQPVAEISAPILVALAVYVGKTRLIDNFTYQGGTV